MVNQGTPGEDQWKTRYPRRDTVGTHLLRWHRTESGGGGLSVAYALHKSEKACQVSQRLIHNSINSWPLHFKFPTIVVEKRNFRFRRYYVISIFKLEYLRFVQSNWDQTGFGKSKMTVTFISTKTVASGPADMTSWKIQLRISFLFYVGLSNKLAKEIWVVHMILRLYKISCYVEGHDDLWGQLQGKCVFFLYRLIRQFISPSITPNFQVWSLKKGHVVIALRLQYF